MSAAIDLSAWLPERRQLAPDLRVLFYGAYSIYYRSDDQAVIVVRVLHGARDLATIVDQDGFDS
ncbi:MULTISPECIES: type II toxin-antitoxin system RelE/ParE family toxin [unclassified Burkholderia]|uniref:type II toxin-antitoxin system RelE/ParE family toxin n=1 Tax=unclassified Burkholderia TaxID=2613784 RepID=UPI00141F3DD9|nr:MULTISPECIES: type II toxin-antitoxin system RelE/ParE family toxin [unclassified Burkholderia]NIE87918.1 type II toxin-antitoxin system RelE/ParE family toxin [Burkholderia sp. Tr-860]NIF62775.1 type II toxin-antitoxin system RelE/ParE family toxin [Burkholderia sp. Cy-647]NIF95572.1 type II toxin-antitoxin system RelE/ParE family toxin [Burkholderia sp. Ax-1720]